MTHITFASVSKARAASTPPKMARTAPVARPKPTPADMHDAHLANAVAKAARTGDQTRLAQLRAAEGRRGG